MTFNPEFRRNLWLELTPQRLVLMPLVLALIFVIGASFGERALNTIAWLAGVIYSLLILLWGCRRAAASVASEVREGTWDWQRMSAISPWSMAWGKLLGSTAFAWYGGLLCLAAVVGAQRAALGPGGAASYVAMMIMAGLIGQGVSLAASLAWLRKTRPTRRLPVTFCQILGIIVGYQLMKLGSALTVMPLLVGFPGGLSWAGELVAWYGVAMTPEVFTLASLAGFLSWALLGLQRLMRAELQVKQWPWAWVLFTLYLIVYVNGFLVANCAACAEGLFWQALLGFALAVVLAYVIAFVEAKDVVRLRGLLAALSAGSWARAASLSPSALPAVALAIVFAAAVIALSDMRPPIDWMDSRDFWSIQPNAGIIAAAVLAVLAFLLRDLALILALNFGERRGRADMAALVYLALLYGLVPIMLHSLDQDWAWVVFWPLQPEQPWLNLALASGQAAAALAFMAWRWRRLQGALLLPEGG